MKRAGIKKIWRWFRFVLLFYILGGVVLYFTQDAILFHPKKLGATYQYQFNVPFREINYPVTGKKNLSIVQFTVPDSIRKGVVLYFHGNRENINRYAPYAQNFTNNSYEVWMMDYPGFGKSTGERNEQVLYDDAYRFYKLARKIFSADSIIIYGKSLGTGIAAQLASVRDCKKLVLETPYYDFPSMLKQYIPIYPIRRMLRYKIPTWKYIQKVTAPVTIFHGSRDWIITYRNSRRLKMYLKPGDEFVTIESGSHNDLYKYKKTIDKLDSLLAN